MLEINWTTLWDIWDQATKKSKQNRSTWLWLYHKHGPIINTLKNSSQQTKRFQSIADCVSFIDSKHDDPTPLSQRFHLENAVQNATKMVHKKKRKKVRKRSDASDNTIQRISNLSINIKSITPANIIKSNKDTTVAQIYQCISDLIEDKTISEEDRTVNINKIFEAMTEEYDIILNNSSKTKIKKMFADHRALGKISGNSKYKIAKNWFTYLKNNHKPQNNQQNKLNDTENKLKTSNELLNKYKIHNEIVKNKSLQDLLNLKQICEIKHHNEKSWHWNIFGEFTPELQMSCIESWTAQYCPKTDSVTAFDKSPSIEIISNENDKEERKSESATPNKKRKRKRKTFDDESDPCESPMPMNKRRKLNNKSVENNNGSIDNEYEFDKQYELDSLYENSNNKQIVNNFGFSDEEYDTYEKYNYADYGNDASEKPSEMTLTCPSCSEPIEKPYADSTGCKHCGLRWTMM